MTASMTQRCISFVFTTMPPGALQRCLLLLLFDGPQVRTDEGAYDVQKDHDRTLFSQGRFPIRVHF